MGLVVAKMYYDEVTYAQQTLLQLVFVVSVKRANNI